MNFLKSKQTKRQKKKIQKAPRQASVTTKHSDTNMSSNHNNSNAPMGEDEPELELFCVVGPNGEEQWVPYQKDMDESRRPSTFQHAQNAVSNQNGRFGSRTGSLWGRMLQPFTSCGKWRSWRKWSCGWIESNGWCAIVLYSICSGPRPAAANSNYGIWAGE